MGAWVGVVLCCACACVRLCVLCCVRDCTRTCERPFVRQMCARECVCVVFACVHASVCARDRGVRGRVRSYVCSSQFHLVPYVKRK